MKTFVASLSVLLASGLWAAAQDNPSEIAQTAAKEFRLVYPIEGGLEDLLKLKVRVKPEMLGKHPRVFWTREETRAHWARSGKTPAELRQMASKCTATIRANLDKGKTAAWETVYQGSQLYWAVEDAELARALIDWMMLAAKAETWDPPTGWRANYDLSTAYHLTGITAAYDTMHDLMTPEELKRIQEKITVQARVGYEYDRLDLDRKRRFSYDQNHHFVPNSTLGLVALATYEELEEAPKWADLARQSMDRVLAVYSPDGFCFEGPQYWSWTAQYIVRYVYALERMTGETLTPRGVQNFKYYLAHSALPPAGKRFNAFHFGDANQKSVPLKGAITHYHDRPIYLNYAFLNFWAPRIGDAQMLGVARFWRPETEMLFVPPDIADRMRPEPIHTMPTYHYFPDMEVLAWRASWEGAPLCVAFKCGPPEGHEFLKLYERFPEASFNFGHAHPDANSFQLDAGGEYLAVGPGYIRDKTAAYENTLLVDGRGQRNDGQYHTWRAFNDRPEIPYAAYDPIRIEEVAMSPLAAYGRGQAAAAYYPDLEIQNARRHIFATAAPTTHTLGHVLIYDEVDSAKPHTYTFLTHTVREMTRETPRRFLARGRKIGLRIEPLGNAPFRAEVAPTLLAPFHAEPTMPHPADPKMDRRAEHVAISTTQPATRGELLTSLLPLALDRPQAAPDVKAIDHPTLRAVELRHPAGIVETKILAPEKKWRHAAAQGVAAAVWWTAEKDGKWTRWAALGATALAAPDATFQASQPLDISARRDPAGIWRGEIRATAKTELRLRLGDDPVLIDDAPAPDSQPFLLEPGRHSLNGEPVLQFHTAR